MPLLSGMKLLSNNSGTSNCWSSGTAYLIGARLLLKPVSRTWLINSRSLTKGWIKIVSIFKKKNTQTRKQVVEGRQSWSSTNHITRLAVWSPAPPVTVSELPSTQRWIPNPLWWLGQRLEWPHCQPLDYDCVLKRKRVLNCKMLWIKKYCINASQTLVLSKNDHSRMLMKGAKVWSVRVISNCHESSFYYYRC